MMLEQLFAGSIPIGLSCLVAAISIVYRARQPKVAMHHTLQVLKFAQGISVSAWALFYIALAMGWHPSLPAHTIMTQSLGILFLNLIAVENFNGRIDAAIERFLSRCRLKP